MMKDFADQDHRGRGVGQEILKFVARQAAERGFCRIDFQVSSTNSEALRLYELMSAEVNSDELRPKISGTAFERLARRSPIPFLQNLSQIRN